MKYAVATRRCFDAGITETAFFLLLRRTRKAIEPDDPCEALFNDHRAARGWKAKHPKADAGELCSYNLVLRAARSRCWKDCAEIS